MKTFALAASVALHLGALMVIPGNDPQRTAANADVVKRTQSTGESCKCDLEMSADCASVLESR